MLKPLPQLVVQTGISEDYWNEYNAPLIRLLKCPYDHSIIESLRRRPIRFYTERFNPFEWDVDVFNFRDICMNVRDGCLTARSFVDYARYVRRLIYGCHGPGADMVYDSLDRLLKR